MDAFDQPGAVLPCWTSGLFSHDPELARMNRHIHDRHGQLTNDIRCGDPRRRRCIGPDFPLDRYMYTTG
jgi:hypothetical protein